MSNQDFPSIPKAAWLAQIQKDLKGKPLDLLDWVVSDELLLSPLVHGEDFQTAPAPLSITPNAWEICEEINSEEAVEANQLALRALEGGVEGLEFLFENKIPDLDLLLNGIYLDFIGLHFSGREVSENPGAIPGQLAGLALERKLPTHQLRGTLGYAPLAAQSRGLQPDWRYLGDLLDYGKTTFPGIRMIHVDVRADHGAPSAVLVELQKTLQGAHSCIEELSKRGVAPQDAVNALHFSMSVGSSYFLEMAKIRAFRLLWLHLLKSWKLPLSEPYICVHFDPAAYTDDLYSNMIRATSMSMSAVLGGANRLVVLPYDAGREAQAQYPLAFSRRIARNVQHLLKMESFLDDIQDPAAGSYYIENLTQTFASKVWSSFSNS